MPSIVTTQSSLSAVHKGSGGITLAFPDVCKTVTSGSPVPIPYPSFAKAAAQKQQKSVGKTVVTRGTMLQRTHGNEAASHQGPVGVKSAEALQLKSMMNQLNGKVQGMPAKDPAQWQAVLTDYLVMASALYLTLSDDD
jgi:hypothetical protein